MGSQSGLVYTSNNIGDKRRKKEDLSTMQYAYDKHYH